MNGQYAGAATGSDESQRRVGPHAAAPGSRGACQMAVVARAEAERRKLPRSLRDDMRHSFADQEAFAVEWQYRQ